MNTSRHLHPTRIVITIDTVNPAADANRYMSAIQRSVQQLQLLPDNDYQEDCWTLIELLCKLHPIPTERDLIEAFKLK